MTDAKKFYEAILRSQRDAIEKEISEGLNLHRTAPYIKLPFMTLPIIDEEMDKAGWAHDIYTDAETGDEYDMFYPKQITEDVDEEDDDDGQEGYDDYVSDFAEPNRY